MITNRRTTVIQAYLFLLPAILLLIAFVYGPLFTSIGYSFSSFENFQPKNFVGLANYKAAFTNGLFWNSISLTFKWVIMNTLLPTFIGLLLALLIEAFIKNDSIAAITRTILFMPMLMSLVAVGILWSLMYDPNIGIVAGVLKAFGINQRVYLYANQNLAIYVAFIPLLWQSSGFAMVIFAADLQGISKDIIEAAVVEGATKSQQIRYIMVPGIMGTIINVLSINMITGFKAFDLIYSLTKGGPGASTNITALYAYDQAFNSFRFDYSSAVMVVLFIFAIMFLLLFQLLVKPLKKRYSV
jgi:ABC-type sugar transport system permease subunit